MALPKRKTVPKPQPRSKAYRQKLEESEARYSSLISHLPVGIYRTNPEGRLLAANPALVEMLGYQNEKALQGIDVRDLYVQGKDRDAHLQTLDQRLICFTEFKLRRQDGGIIWGRDFPRAISGPDGKVRYYDGILVDITKEKKAEERLRRALNKVTASNRERKEMIRKLETLSFTDELTGLYNRRGFILMARQTILIANRRQTPMFLLFLDLDNLKRINDSFGHAAGDDALRRMSDILKATFRGSDIIGRMGGDEFAIFPVDTSEAGVRTVWTRLEDTIGAFNRANQGPFELAFSAGIAAYDPAAPITIEELLAQADKLMYEAKGRKTRTP
jgi:diguanylate cyclase (GGDEF)-like protein/PAS domain S-box-containing protein